jgi:hypothetical protein
MKRASAFILAFSLLSSAAQAHSVNLAWEPSPDPNIAGYRVFYGNHSNEYLWHDDAAVSACQSGVCQISLDLPNGTWYFAVTARAQSGLESAFSNEVSTVLTSGPAVLSPNTEVTWARSCIYEIRWAGFAGPDVAIQLLQQGRAAKTIASRTANDGSLEWRVPSKKLLGADFRIRISSQGHTDESDLPFQIVSPTILRPTNAAVIQRGAVCEIQWNPASLCGQDVMISLLRGKKRVQTLSPSAPNSGNYAWLVEPALKPGGKYRVEVGSLLHPACRGFSYGSFLIE